MKTAWTNRRFFSVKVDITLPTKWAELTDRQLHYFAFLSSHYDSDTVKSLMLLRLLNLTVLRRRGREWKCIYQGRTVYIDPAELVPGVETLRFLDTTAAIRPARMRNFFAVNILLQDDFTFYEYLRTETFWQRYVGTQQPVYLAKMANYLFRTSDGKYADFGVSLSQVEQAIVVLWYIGLKNQLATYFPDFFKKSEAPADETEQTDLMAANDAMIRALTGGDITKEEQVLNTQCWRAFAELNAKARESRELKKLYKH